MRAGNLRCYALYKINQDTGQYAVFFFNSFLIRLSFIAFCYPERIELTMAEVKQVRLEDQNEQSATLLPETVEHGKDEIDFGSAEHDYIGDQVRLPNGLKYLKLPNGVELTLGQIIALAGDFYGIPEHPIIDPSKGMNQVDSGRNPRFSEAYNTLARAPKDELQKELNEILTTLRKDRQTGTSTKAEKWDKITGGKWSCGVPYKPGRMLKLRIITTISFLTLKKRISRDTCWL